MKKIHILFSIILCICINLTRGYSQTGPCSGRIPEVCKPDCMDCTSPTCGACINANMDAGLPIDGGLSWLLISGLGIAAGNHIRRKKKKKTE